MLGPLTSSWQAFWVFVVELRLFEEALQQEAHPGVWGSGVRVPFRWAGEDLFSSSLETSWVHFVPPSVPDAVYIANCWLEDHRLRFSRKASFQERRTPKEWDDWVLEMIFLLAT